MQLIKALLLFFLTLFSGFSSADTYPARVDYMAAFASVGYHSSISKDDACSKIPGQDGHISYYDSAANVCRVWRTASGGWVTGTMSVFYYCDYGGTKSGTSCINAPSCSSGQTRNAITGECQAPVVACNTAGTTTTSGSTQTLTWETSATGYSPCDSHSITCDYPLVVNSTDKRCDLTCPDGSTVNVSAGEQCPTPSCPNQVNGNIITLRSWSDEKNDCVNTGIKQCDGQLEIADAVSGDCLPKPDVKDCGNGIVVIEPVQCPVPPDDSQMIDCGNGIKIYPPRTCAPIPLDPDSCGPGKTAGYINGVAVCIAQDGTSTPVESQSPSTDKYNPQEYKAGVACNSQYSYPCDPSLPVNTSPAVTGIEKCGPGTNFTCVDAFTKPIMPTLYPKEPTPTTTQSTSTGNTTTTYINNDGTTTTSTAITNITGSSTTTGKTTTDCPDCAKESTLREVASRLGGKAAGSGAGTVNAGMGTFQGRGKNTNPDLGKWYEPTEDTYESVIQSNVDSIKNSPIMSFGKDIFSVSIPTGSCPSWTFPAVMGMNEITVAPLCADFMDDLWPLVSAVVQGCAVFMAFRIALTGLD